MKKVLPLDNEKGLDSVEKFMDRLTVSLPFSSTQVFTPEEPHVGS